MKNSIVIWNVAKFNESLDFHWCDIGKVLIKNSIRIERFKMFCRKIDCKCFIEDLITNNTIEFNGAKAEGNRIVNKILEIEMKNKEKQIKHKQVN